MQHIMAIFRKDARHLWPLAASVSALLALAAMLDPIYHGGTESPYYEFLPSVALPVACCLLVVSLIHQDKLSGDRQYWLTRPYAWIELLAAKLLFIVVF